MAHKSRLASYVIDCKVEDIDAAAAFWGAALGLPVRPADADSPTYRGFDTPPDQPTMMVQKVDHPSRIHLDIETDDKEAEVARLEALGAKRIADVKRWVVMEAPTGHRFCVVNPQRPDFAAEAQER
jgi:predicted enzyme related to lactoylglutathione lyase